MNRSELYEHIKQVRVGLHGTPVGTPHSGYEYEGAPVHRWQQGGFTHWPNRMSGMNERYQHWICFCCDDGSDGRRGHDVYIRDNG